MAKISYKRCSTNESKQDVGRQLFGIEFDQEFIEYASGKNEKDRPVFQEVLSLVGDGDELWFQDLSRAGRNALELQATVQKLIDKRVKVVFVSEGLTFVGEGGDQMAQAVSKLMLGMLAAVNELFLTQTSVAVKQGLRKAKASGKKLGGSSPKHKATYQANKAKGLHKRPQFIQSSRDAAQPIVKEITNIIKYSKGNVTQAQICEHLNSAGLKTARGGEFTPPTVSRMIKKFNIPYSNKTKYDELS